MFLNFAKLPKMPQSDHVKALYVLLKNHASFQSKLNGNGWFICIRFCDLFLFLFLFFFWFLFCFYLMRATWLLKRRLAYVYVWEPSELGWP
jgi:hypothetical protein